MIIFFYFLIYILKMADRLERCERSRQHTLDISNLGLSDWPTQVLGFSNLKVLKANKNKFIEISSLQNFRLIEHFEMSRVSFIYFY